MACRPADDKPGVPLPWRVFYGFLNREGPRESEAIQLDVVDIDIERGALTLDENKTDEPRAWALIPWLVKGKGSYSLLALLGVTMAILLLNVTLELKGEVPVRPREWTAQRFVLTFAAALAVLALQWAGVIPPWDPSWAPRLFG